jgi:hypothetical protein
MTGGGHPADLGRGRAVAVGGALKMLPDPRPVYFTPTPALEKSI